jgi:hypothetical protein
MKPSDNSPLTQERFPAFLAEIRANRRIVERMEIGYTMRSFSNPGVAMTWDEHDPAAEAALLAKLRTGGGWAVVPSEYGVAEMGPAGKVLREGSKPTCFTCGFDGGVKVVRFRRGGCHRGRYFVD